MNDRDLLKCRARAMRVEPTPAEKALWKILRGYIADFACFSPRLIIEADGKAHRDPEYDARRDAWFASERFKVLRFSNELVIATPDVVVNTILKATGLTPTYDW